MLGSQVIAKIIKSLGIDKVFVYPGGTIAPLLNSLKTENIKLICTKNEQGAGYAAIGAAKVSGKPQIVLVTSGPGVTNIVTPIADAFYDSVPIIVLTGQVATPYINQDKKVRQTGFQETDTVNIVKSITKYSFILRPLDNINKKIYEAFEIALAGRPGPVLVDLPMDTQQKTYNNCSLDNQNYYIYNKPIYNKPQVKKNLCLSIINKFLKEAKRPLILAGNGIYISRCVYEFRNFVNKINIPVVTSLPAVGVLNKDHPLNYSFLGHTGEFYANLATFYSDLILVFGSRLDIRQTGTETNIFFNKKIIRIDIDANEMEFSRITSNKELRFNIDLKIFFREFSKIAHPKLDIRDWISLIKDWRNKYNSEQFYKDKDKLFKYDIVRYISKITEGLKIAVSTGVGAHQQITARYFNFNHPNRLWLSSCGHGTMGFDLPSIIGALIERQDLDFGIVFVGDGSFQMNIQELATIKEYNLPVKIFVLDDNRLSLVSQFQLLNWKSDPTTGNKYNPNFASIARAYGLNSIEISSKDELTKLNNIFKNKFPTLIHCHVYQKEDVLPMLLAGQELNEMYPFKRVVL